MAPDRVPTPSTAFKFFPQLAMWRLRFVRLQSVPWYAPQALSQGCILSNGALSNPIDRFVQCVLVQCSNNIPRVCAVFFYWYLPPRKIRLFRVFSLRQLFVLAFSLTL